MLEEVGYSREQAEASIRILVEIMEDKLVSKQDLDGSVLMLKSGLEHSVGQLKSDLEHSVSQLESKLENSIAQVESKLTIRMGTMLAASIAILTAIQKLV